MMQRSLKKRFGFTLIELLVVIVWRRILNLNTERHLNMKKLTTLSITIGLLTNAALADTVNFDDLKTGAHPTGWTATKTGKGEAKWTIEKDDTAPSKPNVLKQSGEATYPICIKDDTSLKDGFIEVKFKPVSGKEDQAGGVLWRCKDADN